jgi:hypothetical protein
MRRLLTSQLTVSMPHDFFHEQYPALQNTVEMVIRRGFS